MRPAALLRRMPRARPRTRPLLLLASLSALLAGAPLSGQRDTVPGFELTFRYDAEALPTLAVGPFSGRFGAGSVAPRVQGILARDLRYSDRFNMLDSIPERLFSAEAVDVVYEKVKARERFSIPDPESEHFRMAVHAASDAVVEWIFEEPGMAASRIVFVAKVSGGAKEVFTVDSDGENLRRVTAHGDVTVSPNWSPDGRRIVYNSFKDERPGLYEMDFAAGKERRIDLGTARQPMSPTYHPNGRSLALGVMGGRTQIATYDLEQGCCLDVRSSGGWDDLSPGYSPDGRNMVFTSNRLGITVPQIYVAPAGGGDPSLVSPFIYGETTQFGAPDWSPVRDRIAFHGMIRGNRYHILVVDLGSDGGRRRALQLTSAGSNEHPSWAPDGRHLVFAAERSDGFGLFVIDFVTGRVRKLVSGVAAATPDWSPTLGTGQPAGPPHGDG